MKRKMFVCLLGLVLCLNGCGFSSQLEASTGAEINTPEGLYDAVDAALSEGETSYSFVTSSLDSEDFDNVNQYLEGYYGTISKYQTRTVKLVGKTYVTMECEISDNYYVEQAILEEQDIPENREKAQQLKKACEDILSQMNWKKQTPYRNEKMIHDYIVSHTAYGYKEGDEGTDSDAYSAYGSLVDGIAVCNGYAEAMKLLCDLTEVPCKMVTGQADKENHAWNLVQLEDQWYHVDATWDDPDPDVKNRVLYSYFNIEDTQMSENHTWDTAYFPAAEGLDYNYYMINELYCKNFDAFKSKCEDIFSEDSPDHFQLVVGDYSKKKYSQSNMQFIFDYSGASAIHFQTTGTKKHMTLYFTMDY